MTGEERQQLIDFLLRQRAVFHSEMIELKARVDRTSENVDCLATKVCGLDDLADRVRRHAEAAEVDRLEMREMIDKLIIASESTRDLANKLAQVIEVGPTTHD